MNKSNEWVASCILLPCVTHVRRFWQAVSSGGHKEMIQILFCVAEEDANVGSQLWSA